MELTDIAGLDEWAEIEKEAYRKFGLQSSVFNTKGIRITDTKAWANKVCPEIKGTDKGQTFICATAHMNMANQAEQTEAPVIEECDAGLTKIVIPIFAGNEFIGVTGGCGLLAAGGEVDSFAVNKLTDIDADKIDALSGDIPTISEETIQEVCRFFEEKINALIIRYEKTRA